MHFTAKSKEVYTSVVCFVNYTDTRPTEMQSWCMLAYESEPPLPQSAVEESQY